MMHQVFKYLFSCILIIPVQYTIQPKNIGPSPNAHNNTMIPSTVVPVRVLSPP